MHGSFSIICERCSTPQHNSSMYRLRTFYSTILLVAISLVAKGQEVEPTLELKEKIEQSDLFTTIFTGFALYDPAAANFIYQFNEEKYFTPASNTKILTLLTCLKTLGDSMPTLFYRESERDLIFWGTGDPSFLHPSLPQDTSVRDFLRATKKQLRLSTHNFKEYAFGAGWAWDDYYYAFQTERSPMPIYANTVKFQHEKGKLGFDVFPSLFEDQVKLNTKLSNKYPVFIRSKDSNYFQCNNAAITGEDFERYVPFQYSDTLLLALLQDTLNKDINLYKGYIPTKGIKVLHSQVPVDSIYQKMMQQSDNFLAEQLLLTASNQALGVQNTEMIIDYAKKNLLSATPDELMWYDGSGLSRYNMFTPRSMVYALHEIYKLLGTERMEVIFPEGGVSGTIEKWYGSKAGQPPYLFAKTGTLSHVHCLSGFLKTTSGKTLIFSFMHNNYPMGSSTIKKEMQPILEYIRDNF